MAESLLEKETVLGKELDELIRSMRPDHEFPPKAAVSEEKSKEHEDDAEVEKDEDNTEKAV